MAEETRVTERKRERKREEREREKSHSPRKQGEKVCDREAR